MINVKTWHALDILVKYFIKIRSKKYNKNLIDMHKSDAIKNDKK